MPSREQKTTAGKILMLVAFLNIISTLIPLPDPLSLLLRPLLGFLGVNGEIALALSGGLGFVAFVLGFELWSRNRVTVDEI